MLHPVCISIDQSEMLQRGYDSVLIAFIRYIVGVTFDDIVGVTLYEDRPVEHILCWVNDSSKGYVNTKPIHESYTPLKGDKDTELHEQYPNLEGGLFFYLDCIPNFELIRELCSFGGNLVVLSPESIRQEIKSRLTAQLKQYQD